MTGGREEPVLVSACLLGVPCRYDGKSGPSVKALGLVRSVLCVPICPEQLGGLPTPRPKSHLVEGDGRAVLAGVGRLTTSDGTDVTEAFLAGARETVRLAELFGARRAYLKQRSPSCGCGLVAVDGHPVSGVGVTTAALEAAGIQIEAVD